MHELDDIALLRQYTEQNSEAAFAALVTRHINKVYSVAQRHTRNPHSAEEITQAVFIILAKKADKLNQHTMLSGWLYETSRLTAVTFIRSEIRRAQREQEAHMQTLLNETESDVWPQIAPLLDAAMAGLSEVDRHAVVLRFFDGRTMREVGAALGASEDAAKKRVNRAVEKLRGFFTKRGVVLSTAVLTAAISANSVQAAPAVLAKSITAVAMTKGIVASGSSLTLIKGALKLMAWTKIKTAVAVGAGILLAVGTTTIAFKEVSHYREKTVWDHITPATNDANRNGQNWRQLEKAPPAVSLRPTKFNSQMANGQSGNGKMLGFYQPFDATLSRAYDISPSRIVPLTPLPSGDFDFIVSGPNPRKNALRLAIENQYGLVGRLETRDADVLLLKVKRSNASGLKPVLPTKTSISFWGVGHLRRTSGPIRSLANDLEQYLQIPVVDQTGLAGYFDYDLKWDDKLQWDSTGHSQFSNSEGLKQTVLDQLGLELVPGHEPIEVLVVEKVK
ncbi:MAG TPA: TIGR03435 family protein [Verrucomicrobiae bacterium]